MVKDLETKFKYPICGSLRIGEKNEKNVPQKLDYFTVHKDTHTEKDVVEQFNSKFDKPKELTINFLSEEPFDTHYLRYGKSILLCKGDGESAITKGDDNKWTKCECSKKCIFRGNKCKLTGKLFFLIKDIDIGGLWKLETQSNNTIQNILMTLNFLKCMNVNITEHDFKLITQPQETIVDGKLKKYTTIKLKMVINNKEEVLKKSNISKKQESGKKDVNDEKQNNSSYISKNTKSSVEKTDKQTILQDEFENYLTLIEIENVNKSGNNIKKAKFCTMKDDEIVELLIHPDIVEKFSEYVPSSCILPLDIYEKNGNKILKDYKEIEIIKAV